MLVLAVSTFAVLIYNGSRAALLASVMTALLYMVARGSAIRAILQSYYLRFGTIGAFGFTGLMVLIPQIFENPFADGSSLWIRWQLLSTIPELVMNWPIGVGVNNFLIAIPRLAVDTNGILSPHNWALELVGEFGILGLLIFVFIVGRSFDVLILAWVKTLDPLPLALSLSLVAFLIAGLGPSSVFWSRHMPWVIFGFVISYEQCYSSQLVLHRNPE